MDEAVKGTFSYRNWKEMLSGKPILQTVEFPIFTDAYIVAEAINGYGPYKLFNAVPGFPFGPHRLRPTIVLRVDEYSEFVSEAINWDDTDDKNYHGGYLKDEIAALVSLILGIRAKAGNISRRFSGNDPKGRPAAYAIDLNPILPEFGYRLILPRVLGERSLTEMSSLSQFVELSPKQSTALVHSARLYQEGVWLSESTPELSWLLLTSAIETAANYWKPTQETPIERMRASRPNLETILEDCGDEIILKVAEEVSIYMGATSKFLKFIQTFLPDAPNERPELHAQHKWNWSTLKKSLNKVYEYRSRALHAGIPFPAPMCESPSFSGQVAEIPLGLATSSHGAVWLQKDIPILLQTFEYIVRNTLLNWWDTMLDKSD